jgi:hypothetical protein
MSKRFLQLMGCVGGLCLLGCDSPVKTDWQGHYQYEHVLGEGAGGVGQFVSYDLSIAAGVCTLDRVGLQTDEHLVCALKPAGDAIAIAFKSYADGSVQNALGVAVYQVGDTLFALKKQAGVIHTHWGALAPDGLTALNGEFFKPVLSQ